MTSQPPAHPVTYSAVCEQVYMVFPNDLNANDTVFGGEVEHQRYEEAQLRRELRLQRARALQALRARRAAGQGR